MRAPLEPAPQAPLIAPDLVYVQDTIPGIRRHVHRGKFVYTAPDGERIRDEATLARINGLAIPPAYRDVWICPDPRGHVQATAKDARGRKQYRYHPRWNEIRDAQKYDRLSSFARALPRIRKAIDLHLAEPGLGHAKMMATVVCLLERTLIRVGNPRYARENHSFGLTTLHNRHVTIDGSAIRFHFRGKSGIEHRIRIEHPRLARILRRCQDLPGQHLFQYLDGEGQRHAVGSNDINDFLRAHGGGDFTAKDYRTWAGSVLALERFRRLSWDGPDAARRRIPEVVAEVARALGNTPAVCRKRYIHPAVIDAFVAGELAGLCAPRRRTGMSSAEAGLLAFLEAHPAPA